MPAPISDAEIRRTWASRYTVDENGCHIWNGALSWGYGVLGRRHGDRVGTHRAHRYAYELFVGPIPEGLMVRHRCHNRRCCNPDHLELGTNRDNVQDNLRDGKPFGRKRTFDRHWAAFFKALVDNGATYSRLGERYNASRGTIRNTINRHYPKT